MSTANPHASVATPSRGVISEVRSLVALAIPIVVGLTAATLIGVTDTLMIAPLGTVPLAAAALTSTVIVLFYASIYGFLSAVGVVIAEAHGARDRRAIARHVRGGLVVGAAAGLAGLTLMLAIGLAMPHLGQPPEVVDVMAPYWGAMALMLVPFALLLVMKQFFDAVDRPWIGVGFSFLAVGLNVPLNWLLIYGVAGLPGLGLFGAGIGSLLSETLAFMAALAYWRSAPTLRRMRVRSRPSGGDMRTTARLGAPLGLAYLGETGAYSLVGVMLGWFGAAALAAHQVVNAVGTVAYMLPLGMAAAVTIRIGQARGAGEGHRLPSIAIAALGTVLGWMLLMTVILALSAETVAAALADDPAVVAIAAAMFLVVALMQVMDGLQSTAFGALRGLGDTAWPSAASVLIYWVVALPASYVAGFVLGWGPVAVWGGFGAGLAIAAVALGWRLAALLRSGDITSEPG